MKFRIFDKVRVCNEDMNIPRHPIGTVGIIVRIDMTILDDPLYTISDGSSVYSYTGYELELIDMETYSVNTEAIKTQTWELAKKLYSYEADERVKIFNDLDASNYEWILDNYTPDEVSAKIREYEDKYVIRVGDIITYPKSPKEFIVLNTEDLLLISTDFTVVCEPISLTTDWEKTGRSIDLSELVKVVDERSTHA